MTSGFDKLEKFFSLSRGKDKALQEKRATSKKTVSVHAPYTGPSTDASSFFPSPSFLKPTSSRMQPRNPLYQKEEEELPLAKDRNRSRSLPNVKKSLQTGSSAYESLEVERKTRSYDSSLTPSAAHSPSTPESTGFRFPEDSLFRSPEAPSTPVDASPQRRTGDSASPETPKQESRDTQLLDWCPRHISLMFKNPDELLTVDEQLGLASPDDIQQSMLLMPSPIFAPPERPPPRSPLRRRRPRTPPTPQMTTTSPRSQEWEFSTFPPQYSVINSPTCKTFSPPTSESEDEYATAVSTQSDFTDRSGVPSIYSAESSPDTAAKIRRTPINFGRAARETWGSRRQDPMLPVLDSKIGPAPKSRLKKTQSAATLTAAQSKIAKEHILQEPTINDIYALSDEDIFETRPLTPASSLPPSPPPKDEGYVRLQRRTPTHSLAHTRFPSALTLRSGQVTPPVTPTDPSFLIPMPPSPSAGQRGAIMAAGIAKKYNFDLIYLVSLWPSAGGNQMDPSLRVEPQWPRRSTAAGGSIYTSPKSKITGRYLAAFGLSQIGEPFKIQTRVLLKALRSEGWNEYDDASASLSHGWACSFKTDYVSLENQGVDAVWKSARNRGIVFAGYTRRGKEANIPKDLLNKRAHLGRLHEDVKGLVDALVQ